MNAKQLQLISIILLSTLILSSNVSSLVSANEESEPISRTHLIPLQSWAFIKETNLTPEHIVVYEWISPVIIQCLEVTEKDYIQMFELSLTERSAYFENLGYLEKKSQHTKTTTSENGTIYFVFFNPNNIDINVDFTFTYKSNNVQPWFIGLISAIVIVIVLSIGFYIAMRVRSKMLLEQFEEEEREEKSPAQKYMET